MTTGKTIALTRWNFVGKVMSLLFNTLSRFIILFLSQSKWLLMAAVNVQSDLGDQKNKTYQSPFPFFFSVSVCNEVIDLDVMILVFWVLTSKPAHSLFSFTLFNRPFSYFLSVIRVESSAYMRLLIFLPSNLIPVCDSHSLAFRMMYSAYKLNKQGENI